MTGSDSAFDDSRASPVSNATLDFLRWLTGRTPSYKEAWEMWQTTCPRESTWEDAFIAGLVRADRLPGEAQPVVVLTPLGRSVLERADA